jgi:NADH:ubiquinone oxidoreductase subunit K
MSDPFLAQYLAVVLFAIGLLVVLSRRNLLFVLMGVELMLNAVNLSFVSFSRVVPVGAVDGQLTMVFVIALAAAEACIGLAMVVCLLRGRDSLDVDSYATMKE